MAYLDFREYGARYNMDCILSYDAETSSLPSSIENNSDSVYNATEFLAKNRNNAECNRNEMALNSISNNGNTIHYLVDSENDKMFINGKEEVNTNIESVDCESNNIYLPQFTSIFKLGFYRPDIKGNNNDSIIFIKPTDKVQKFEKLRADDRVIYNDNKQSKRKFLNFIAYLDGDKYNNDSITGSLHRFNKVSGNIELIDCVIDEENENLDDRYILACDLIAVVSGDLYKKANKTQERLIRSAVIGKYIETSYCYYILKSHYDSLDEERQKTLITKFYINYKTNEIYIKYANNHYLLYGVSRDEKGDSNDDILASYTKEQKDNKSRSLLGETKKTLQLCNKFFISADYNKGILNYPLKVVPILKQKYKNASNNFFEVLSKGPVFSNLEHKSGLDSVEAQDIDIAIKKCGEKCLAKSDCTGYNIRQSKKGWYSGIVYLCHFFDDKYQVNKHYSDGAREIFSKVDETDTWDINTSFNYMKNTDGSSLNKKDNQCKYIDHSNAISFDNNGNLISFDLKYETSDEKYTDKYLLEGNVGQAFNAFGSYIIDN